MALSGIASTAVQRTKTSRYQVASVLLVAIVMVLVTLPDLYAQSGEADLAKQAQNPFSDLISLPFQNNTSFGIGPNDRTQNVLNIQPVAPFQLNDQWNLITRTIVPIISQPDVRAASGHTSGLGDINASFFLSPAKPAKVIWGMGRSSPCPPLPTKCSRRTSGDSGRWPWC